MSVRGGPESSGIISTGEFGFLSGDDATIVFAQKRSEWLDAKLAGNYSDVDLDRTGKISYNTIARYRSGGSILPRTRRGLCDALKVLGISNEFSEVPE